MNERVIEKGFLCFARQEDYHANWIQEGAGSNVLCGGCGRILDDDYFNPDIKLAGLKEDFIFSMLGGGYFVSSRVRDFIEENGYRGVMLRNIGLAGVFHLNCRNFVRISTEKLDYSGKCPECKENLEITSGNARRTIGKKQYYEIVKDIVDDGLFFTDIRFFKGITKHRLLVIGKETHEKLKKAKIRGLIADPLI